MVFFEQNPNKIQVIYNYIDLFLFLSLSLSPTLAQQQ
jgi:hypothetical protein